MGNTASAAAAAAPRAKTVLRVVGLGDPVTDIVVQVDPAALTYLGAQPGSCVEVRAAARPRARAGPSAPLLRLLRPAGAARARAGRPQRQR